MSTESEVVHGTIEIRDTAVSQTGFGVPMLAVFHNLWPEKVRTFSDLAELTAAPLNVPTDHAVYRMSRALKSQVNSPSQWKIGKRAGSAVQVVALRPLVGFGGSNVYSLVIDGTPVSYTASGSDPAAIATGIAAAISAADIDDITAVASSVDVTITGGTTGVQHSFESLSLTLAINDISLAAEPHIDVDLSDIRLTDEDWYGLMIDSSSKNDILKAAQWAEAQKVLFMPTTADGDAMLTIEGGEGGGLPSDVLSQLTAAGYHRTIPLFHEKPTTQYASVAWGSRMLAKPPGSANWANKSLAGVDTSKLNDSFRGVLKSRNGNYYVAVKGIGFTLDGRASSGRYADITHGMDWFDARVQERIVGVLANSDKIGFTDKHIDIFRAQVLAQILEGIAADVIDGDSPYSVTVPLVAAVNPNDKIARTLRNLRFSLVLQGAVNSVEYQGDVLIAAPLAA